jgi:hypothetical protein
MKCTGGKKVAWGRGYVGESKGRHRSKQRPVSLAVISAQRERAPEDVTSY